MSVFKSGMTLETCYEKGCPLYLRFENIVTWEAFEGAVLGALFRDRRACLVCRYFIRPNISWWLERLKRGGHNGW